MNKFDEVYNRIISQMKYSDLYNVNNSLLVQEKNQYLKYISQNNPGIACSYPEDDCLCQETYFQGWDVNTSCIDAVNKILQSILNKYKNSNNIQDLELKYPIKKLLNEIDYSTLSNYKNFHKFLDLLKQNASGFITISIGKSNQNNNNDSYYQPPIKFGYPPKNGLIVDSYYQYLEDITKNDKTWHNKINTIIKQLFKLNDFGTINLSALSFKRGQEKLKSDIAHQISHFIKFLIRINGLNYSYGLNYSRKDLDYKNGENYFSKPDEWKQLAATYIEQLRIIFDNLKLQHNFQNALKFINSILYTCEVPLIDDKSLQLKDFNFYISFFNSSNFHKNDIVKFIKTTYQNSNNQNNVRNTWKVFKKFLLNQFKRRYKNE